MTSFFRHRHVAVTGASAGIGRALALHLGGLGAKLTLVARRESLLEDVKRELALKNAQSVIATSDMGELDTVKDWLAPSQAELGPIDVLVLNAGVQYVGPAKDLSDADAERQLCINVMAPVRLAKAVLPDMIARKSGTLVIVSSVAALSAPTYMADYAATKAYVATYFETLREELKGTGVNVLTVYPGPVLTELEQKARERLEDGFLQRQVPTGTPEELAKRMACAIEKGCARLIYPRTYELTRFARVASQWLTHRFSPKPRA